MIASAAENAPQNDLFGKVVTLSNARGLRLATVSFRLSAISASRDMIRNEWISDGQSEAAFSLQPHFVVVFGHQLSDRTVMESPEVREPIPSVPSEVRVDHSLAGQVNVMA